MSRSSRISLFVIGVSLFILSPVNLTNMMWDHNIARTLYALYLGVLSWGIVLIAACILLYAALGNGD